MKGQSVVRVKNWSRLTKFIVLTFFYFLLFFSVAFAVSETGSGKPAILYEIVPSGEITKVSYYLKEYQGMKTIFFEVSLKNVSDLPKSYRIKVFVDDGPSGGCYIKLKPGETLTGQLPIVIFPKLPQGFTIQAEEIEL